MVEQQHNTTVGMSFNIVLALYCTATGSNAIISKHTMFVSSFERLNHANDL